MKLKRPSLSNLLFGIFIVLLLIPQTRTPIQVAVNQLKMFVFSPSAMDENEQVQIEPFEYVLSDLSGDHKAIPIGNGKISFISYWATWCPPCIAELPSIQALHADYGDQLQFILITNEDPAIAKRFMDKKGYTLPVYFPKMQTPDALDSNSLPTNYIIDSKGNIVVKEKGAADWNSKKVRELLDGLIKASL
ncbi:TlpA family protein disulfide reductase [Maribacter chungangensis]|uniref:TlpA family protein disulfide reductase n=1 Tax=Maribacter chungangensis TaxID=1069117 RepID=A0ABW3B5B2_9FLAO